MVCSLWFDGFKNSVEKLHLAINSLFPDLRNYKLACAGRLWTTNYRTI